MQEVTPECAYSLVSANSGSSWELWRYGSSGIRLVASFNSSLVTHEQAEAASRLLMGPDAPLEFEKTDYPV